MVEDADPSELEKILLRKYLDHGLVDLTVGIFFISILIAGIVDSSWSSLFVSTPLIIMGSLGPLLWKKIVTPRLGYVKWGKIGSGRANRPAVLLYVITGVFFTFAVVVALSDPRYPSDREIELHRIIIGILCLLIFSITGLVTGVSRFHYYGVAAVSIFIVAHLMDASAFSSFGTLGIIIFINGALLLERFLREHPILDAEGEDVEG
jgi:hypothetical protein